MLKYLGSWLSRYLKSWRVQNLYSPFMYFNGKSVSLSVPISLNGLPSFPYWVLVGSSDGSLIIKMACRFSLVSIQCSQLHKAANLC